MKKILKPPLLSDDSSAASLEVDGPAFSAEAAFLPEDFLALALDNFVGVAFFDLATRFFETAFFTSISPSSSEDEEDVSLEEEDEEDAVSEDEEDVAAEEEDESEEVSAFASLTSFSVATSSSSEDGPVNETSDEEVKRVLVETESLEMEEPPETRRRR